MGWGISASCIQPIHQLQAGKTQSLAPPQQSKGGEEIFPLELRSSRHSCWRMLSSGKQGEGKAAPGAFHGGEALQWDKALGMEPPGTPV